MCSCKGAQLCTLILKAEYGQMSFNAENTNKTPQIVTLSMEITKNETGNSWTSF